MKKIILALAFLASFTGFAEAQTSRNPCYTDKGQTTQGIPNCIGVGTSTPLPVTNSGTQTVSGAVTVGSYPTGSTAVTGNASAAGTSSVQGVLAGAASKTTYICGFNVTALGTGLSPGPVTIAGLVGSSQVYQMGVLSTGVVGSLNQTFTPCIPASAVNTSITVTTTADASATAVSVNSWGYQQ